MDAGIQGTLDYFAERHDGFEIDIYTPWQEDGKLAVDGLGVHFWLARPEPPCLSFLLEPGYDIPDAHQCHAFDVASLACQPDSTLRVNGIDGRILVLSPGVTTPKAKADMARWQQYVEANPQRIAAADAKLRAALQEMQAEADAR